MIYSKVRDYVNSIIGTYNLKKWDDAFNIDNIPTTLIDNGYHLSYSVPTITKQQRTIEAGFSVTLNFFFKGYKTPSQKLDDAMDLVASISRDLASQDNVASFRVTDDYPIQDCNPISQVPTFIESNDNIIIITLELEMTVISTIC